jgi:peptidoglycan glycosyltransferase
MLPESCDPGYALLGLDIGAPDLVGRAKAFGYDQTNPIDLPGVVNSYIPSAKSFRFALPQLAYSAIGQENVRVTALQNALVAAGVADHGTVMTPHFLYQIVGPEGQIVKTYQPHPWLKPLTKSQAAQIVPLMENVVKAGTATQVGFPAIDDVAAKTGTAQTGTAVEHTDDWMIAFAPASHPVIALAVIVPFQNPSTTGAEVAGPVMKCMIEGAIAMSKGLPAAGTSTTCPK